jgi:outer membrane protein TolC
MSLFGLIGLNINGMANPTMPEASIPQLEQLIETALTQSPRMMIRNADFAAATASLQTAKAARLPNVGGSASYLKSREDRGDFLGSVPADKLYYNFAINQPLFHWGEISRNIQNAEIRLAIDEGRTRKAHTLLANEVRVAFLELVRARRALERAQFASELSILGHEETRVKRQQNIVSDAEIYSAEITQQKDEYTLGIARDAFMTAGDTLARLTGTSPLGYEAVPNTFPVPDIQGDASVVVGLLADFLSAEIPSNTDLEMARQELEIRQNDLKNAKVALRPKFGFIAGISLDEQAYDRNIANKYEVQSLYAGVNVSWTLFDGFATKGRIRTTLERMRSAEVTFANTKATLLDDAQSHGRLLKSLALAVVIAERELDSAQNQLEAFMASRERGEASEAQVNVARLSLHTAVGAALYARENYWNKLGSFMALIDADPILNRIGQ